ncbi:morphogenetic protein [Klebsiella pneumoniae]|nr:morphogenetic protein [Klebsiella pneumoniae]
MKERGMIFNGEMVRAILDGRKTQTRRPVKFPVHDKNLGCELAGNELAGELSAGNYLNSAFGKPGDRIWVREAYRLPASLDDVSPTGVGEMAVATGYRKPWAPTFYEFTGTFSDGWKGFETPPKVSDAGKLRPSIHMPRWASRILLEITDVRVERLNAISEEDAQREGVHTEVWDQTVVARNYAVSDEFFQFWSDDMPPLRRNESTVSVLIQKPVGIHLWRRKLASQPLGLGYRVQAR